MSCVAPIVLNQGANQKAVGTCRNNAGVLSATKTVSNIDIDLTKPTVTLSSPVQGRVYARNAAVKAQFTCADALSGSASCVGTLKNGATIKHFEGADQCLLRGDGNGPRRQRHQEDGHLQRALSTQKSIASKRFSDSGSQNGQGYLSQAFA